MDINDLSMMVGKTIVEMTPIQKEVGRFALRMNDGSAYVFYHEQDCCESVVIEDVCGDVADLLHSPLLQAEEVVSTDARPDDPFTGFKCDPGYDDSQTWTFYKFATIRGSVTIRWLGQSNGYYGESVDIKAYRSGEEVPGWMLPAPTPSLPQN